MNIESRVSHLLVLVALLSLGAGCVVSIGDQDESRAGTSTRPRQEVPKPPVVVMPANTEDAATLAEIDAAAKLAFDGSKVAALRNVAARPSLTPPAQVHLVNTALRVIAFDGSRVELLKVLIENPAFSPAAKEAIFRQIERIAFDGSRSEIITAIQKRSSGN